MHKIYQDTPRRKNKNPQGTQPEGSSTWGPLCWAMTKIRHSSDMLGRN